MKKKLLILKSGSQYYRFSGGKFEGCDLNKASVYPVDQIEAVLGKRNILFQSGISSAEIKLLTIIEEDYKE